jgi:plastocyanin
MCKSHRNVNNKQSAKHALKKKLLQLGLYLFICKLLSNSNMKNIIVK